MYFQSQDYKKLCWDRCPSLLNPFYPSSPHPLLVTNLCFLFTISVWFCVSVCVWYQTYVIIFSFPLFITKKCSILYVPFCALLFSLTLSSRNHSISVRWALSQPCCLVSVVSVWCSLLNQLLNLGCVGSFWPAAVGPILWSVLWLVSNIL